MASVWFTVIVLVVVQTAFGNICKDNNKLSCDECIRCGGQWCKERGSVHCDISQSDEGWCPYNRETTFSRPRVTEPGDLVSPKHVEETLYIELPSLLDIKYTARIKQKPNITITNSTQNFNIIIKEDNTDCKGVHCTTTIETRATKDFCSSNGGNKEYVHIEVGVGGLSEKVILKYHVSCACECTQIVEKSSVNCSKHGDLSCGVCHCDEGWEGDDCSKAKCNEPSRGDVPCASKDNVQCSGNGYCGPCDTCICYTDRVGSQYFDQENDCIDICTTVSYCDTCLVNNTLGKCHECMSSVLYVQKYNESLLNDRDEFNKTIWVNCNETVGDCLVSYVAMRDVYQDINVMVVESCNTIIVGAQGAESKVSIVLAVLAVLAVVAAAGGVLYWHQMNAVPQATLNNPGYQNIVAEGSSGQNPLYKDPWSSFKNPMYGDKS